MDRDRVYARLLAPSQDGNLWLLDEAGFELKKMEIATGRIVFTTSLDLVLPGKKNYDFRFMREYQNQLFLADHNGAVLVFDLNGTFRKTLPLNNCDWFGFDDDELMCMQEGALVYYHLLKHSLRKEVLPEPFAQASEVLYSGNRLYGLVKGNLYDQEL